MAEQKRSSFSRPPLKDSHRNFCVLPGGKPVSCYIGNANFYGLFTPFGHDPGPVSSLPHTCVKQKCSMAGSAVKHAPVR